uniref:PDZ domain-containing protein n=1 Tax=Ascaris lumbricoides TaxID=6252 RepID=A0A0M3HZ52_ASCLU
MRAMISKNGMYDAKIRDPRTSTDVQDSGRSSGSMQLRPLDERGKAISDGSAVRFVAQMYYYQPLLESLAHQQPTATTPTAQLGTQSQCGKPGGASAASREASSSTFASRKGAWIGRYKRYPSSGFCLCDRLMKLNDSVSASKILSVHQKCDSVQILVESPCY